MRNRTSEDTLCLVGGALLGAAAMYLLDPETGDRRRRRIASAAESAYESARDSIGEGWEKLSDRTGDLGETASDYTQGLADQARGIASGLTGAAGSYLGSGAKSARKASRQAGNWGSKLMDRAHDVYARARDSVMDYGHSAADEAEDQASGIRSWGKRLFGRAGDELSSRARRFGKRATKAGSSIRAVFTGEEEHEGVGAAGVTSTALACCAVGAGLMYFLDPQRGRARRNVVSEKVGHFTRSTGQSMRATGQHLANRVRGTAYKASRKAQNLTGMSGPVSSDQLVSRIRSEMGHIISNPSQVQLMADTQGSVTVMGTCPADESEKLLVAIRAVPGVTDVINLMDSSGQSAQASGRQTASRSERRDQTAPHS
ncbi:MAG TPA: YtxH domain-containing protein [Tepidisphaeraceae bacterium]|jgi:gas vesicle protein|nr:YtxH domain-containing protein [Tepidisphaeraceae bacterium]